MENNLFAPVSVIIPCFNCEDTIDRAVESVYKQTWKPAEVILVDDASMDRSFRKLLKLQEIYGSDWIKVIHSKKNEGPGGARNMGWDIATQPYIAFLDADDAWHPRKIEIQLSYMLEHPDIVITGHRTKRVQESDNINIEVLPTHYNIKPISPLRMLLSNYLPTRSVILKREIDLRFELNKRFSEDYLLWLSIILSGNKGAFINCELGYTYKAPYGEKGLSANLWSMEKGELDTFYKLLKLGKLSIIEWPLLSMYSFLKFLLRWFKHKIRFIFMACYIIHLE